MSEIPEQARARLSEACYRRIDPERVIDAFRKLEVEPPEAMAVFYATFRGPFFSRRTSYELLDAIEQSENVMTVTATCREEFSFPPYALVLTNLNANAVLICDARSGAVYDVDFEGGDAAFVNGELPPRWASFEAFLRFYFAECLTAKRDHA